MFQALPVSAHRIKTAFGVSGKKYGNDCDEALQGPGQENGFGPGGWAIVSAHIIKMMRALSFGARFLPAMSGTLVAFACCSFVEDTDVVDMAQDMHTTGEEIIRQIEAIIDHCERRLRATGGAIVPQNGYWSLIDWICEKENWRYATIDDAQAA
jgi:hypothetical protein